MIDQVDDTLSHWVENVLSGIKPSMAPPSDASGTMGVNLYLLEVVEDPLRQNTQHLPIQPALKYLVTTHADEPKDAHRLLAALLFAAFEHSRYEVDLNPVPHNTWSAFKVAPRPSFILRVPLPFAKPVEDVPVVREGLTSRGAPMVGLWGVLLGPERTAVANGRIELINLYRYAYTDSRGQFSLAGVPAAPTPKLLRVKARNREVLLTVRETGSAENPVVFHFDFFHDLFGRLVDGRTSAPIQNAFIELPPYFRTTYTDESGRFILEGVPQGEQYELQISLPTPTGTRLVSQMVSGASTEQAPIIVQIAER